MGNAEADELSECYAQLHFDALECGDWEFLSVDSTNGFAVYKHTVEERCFRCEGVILSPANTVLDCLWDWKKRAEWDVHVLPSSENMSKLSKQSCISYIEVDFPSQTRDFLVLQTCVPSPTGCTVLINSCEQAYCNPKEGITRGDITRSGYILKAADQQSTEVHFVLRCDVKGWVPDWVANMFLEAFVCAIGNMPTSVPDVTPEEAAKLQLLNEQYRAEQRTKEDATKEPVKIDTSAMDALASARKAALEREQKLKELADATGEAVTLSSSFAVLAAKLRAQEEERSKCLVM